MRLVVGAGGLVGSAVVRKLRVLGLPYLAATNVPWGTPSASIALSRLVREVATATREWQILWCAGAGVTDSTADDFEREILQFGRFIAIIRDLEPETRARGSIVFTSSAGGVYGGATAPCTEATAAVPLGLYGATKLRTETMLTDFARSSEVRVLIARLSNVYGPGQNLTKPQGLVSRLALSALRRQPLSVYVSLDTLRDYLYVDDCAARLVAASDRLTAESAPRSTTKIIGSGRSTSVAALIREFEHVLRSRALIVMGSSPSAALQGRDLRLRSTVWSDLDAVPQVTLPEGIHRTLEHLRAQLSSPAG